MSQFTTQKGKTNKMDVYGLTAGMGLPTHHCADGTMDFFSGWGDNKTTGDQHSCLFICLLTPQTIPNPLTVQVLC